MELLSQALINWLVLSAMYITVALGFALLLSINGILNFAHGAIYMVGSYICYQFAVDIGVNQWIALAAAAIIMGIIGVLIERFCFRPFGRDSNRTTIIVIALILFLETLTNVTVGIHIRALPPFNPGTWNVGNITISNDRLTIIAIGSALLILVVLFIQRSKLGQQMMATAQNGEGALLQGISINRVSMFACALGCGLAAIAGSLMGALTSLSPFMGDYMLVKAIQLVIIAGIGSIGGILYAGLIVGVIDATLPLFLNGSVAELISLGVIIILLLFKPQGLFGYEG